jgi:hypothetical protein
MPRLLVVLLVVLCCVVHCQHLRAPAGWYMTRARQDGSYQIAPVLGRPQDDLEDAKLRRDLDGPEPVSGLLHCTGATLHQNGTSVWCQR